MYGSGDFYDVEDKGYVYGWLEELPSFTIRAYLKTFTPDTIDAKAGIQFREQAKSNVPFLGIFIDGNNKIKILRRGQTDAIVEESFETTLLVHQGIWFQMIKDDNKIYFQYSLDSETTSISMINWVTLDASVDDTDSWSALEKHLSVSSASDNVNLAYFTKVYTDDCWISPIGQKED